jgi:uncharacterized membrane protein
MAERTSGVSRWLPTHRMLLAAVAVLAVATVVGAALLYAPAPAAQQQVADVDWYDARLTAAETIGPALYSAPGSGHVDVRVSAVLDDTGEEISFITFAEVEGMYRPGQRVVLALSDAEDPDRAFYVVDVRRERPIALLVGLFALCVIALGRWQGVRALLGLAVTVVVIVFFLVPSVLAGRPPVAVALVGAGLILLATMYLAHGYSAKTTVAIVGTAAALLVTALLAEVFTWATSVTGVMDHDTRLLSFTVGDINIRGLLLAGIIIGGLGVLDDVTMIQSSTVFQVRRASRQPRLRDLFSAGMAVGRDHVAATVNTLFLAYVGAALPLILLFSTYPAAFTEVLSLEIVAVEVVRTFVGSIGLIAAVPVTTALAAAMAIRDPDAISAEPDHEHAHVH